MLAYGVDMGMTMSGKANRLVELMADVSRSSPVVLILIDATP